MKRFSRIAAITLIAGTTLGVTANQFAQTEFDQLRLDAKQLAMKLSNSVTGNPIPTALGVATFLLTAGLRKVRVKPTAKDVPSEIVAEPLVVRRALARATWTQLLSDQIALENRSKSLPGAIKQAERDACYAENALSDAVRSLEAKEKANDEAATRLAKLRGEKETAESEATAIKAELQKLAGVI